MADISLVLKDVTKTFPERNGGIFNAVDKVNIEVAKGEMVTFLGPSGCGKTTTLRMIAGFVIPTSGSITIEGKDMTSVPVNERAIGFVFQNYALFPHMTIYKNVGYGLKARGEKDADIHDKIINALKLVGLSGDENRYPNQLSGGEQQRVALARVIVPFDGRTAFEPRRKASDPHAHGDPQNSKSARNDVPVRHARPIGSAYRFRQNRRYESR